MGSLMLSFYSFRSKTSTAWDSGFRRGIGGAVERSRPLDVDASMGSKILKGDRSLTVEHVRKLAARFGVRAELFID